MKILEKNELMLFGKIIINKSGLIKKKVFFSSTCIPKDFSLLTGMFSKNRKVNSFFY